MAKAKGNASAPRNNDQREAEMAVLDLDDALLESTGVVKSDARGKEEIGFGGYGGQAAYSVSALARKVRKASTEKKPVILKDGRDFSTDSAKLASVVNRINRGLRDKEKRGLLAFENTERLQITEFPKGCKLRDSSGALAKAGAQPVEDEPGFVENPTAFIRVIALAPAHDGEQAEAGDE